MALLWRLISVGIFRYSFKKSTIIKPVGCVATLINLLKMTSELRKVRLRLTACIVMYLLSVHLTSWVIQWWFCWSSKIFPQNLSGTSSWWAENLSKLFHLPFLLKRIVFISWLSKTQSYECNPRISTFKVFTNMKLWAKLCLIRWWWWTN